MSDFSKGKWRYSEINNTVVIDDDRYIPVAFLLGCSMFSKQEYQANGRLMAAAPEMYEMITKLVDGITIAELLNGMQVVKVNPVLIESAKRLLAEIDGEDE